MKIIHRSKLKHLEFTFAAGDLFEADVDSIVSSEQTDFILSGNPNSISGQIRHRYGRAIQQELDDATQGATLRPGTVIDTAAGSDFRRIFHAGFHEPADRPGTPGASSFADYLEAIGLCVSQVLDSARAQKLTSVAFPLIGCGVFGLDEKMLILQFLDAIETFDGRLNEGETMSVWLVIRDREQFESVVGTLLELLLRQRSQTVAITIEPTGVSVLDRFAERLGRRANADWAKWLLCRYAEIAVEIMCYSLCRAVDPVPTPESLFEEERPATFGSIRERAMKLAVASQEKPKEAWGAEFFARVLMDDTSARAMGDLVSQRNNLAHGKKSLAVAELRELVGQGLRLRDWVNIPKTDGELRLADWIPWVAMSPSGGAKIGLFERWQKNAIRYLVPETGELIKVSRSAMAASSSRQS